MQAIWFAILCTASVWLYLLSTFTPETTTSLSPFISPLLIGIIAASLSFRKTDFQQVPLKAVLFVIPLLLIRLSVPFPYSLGAVLMLAGLLIWFTANRVKPLAPLAAGFLFNGFILLVQSAFMPLYYILAARYHEVKLLNLIAYPFVRFFGLNVSISEGIIYIPTFEDLLAFPGTLEKAGFYLFFLMIVGGMTLIALFDRRGKTFLRFFAICLGYTLLRYVVMIYVYAQANDAEIYWNPAAFSLSYVPLAIILYALLPIGSAQKTLGLPIPDFKPKDLKPAVLFFVSVFCFIGVWGFDDPGERKPGRILIDEKHSNWEWSTRKFDTTWFGSQSTYNYYCMADYFSHFYQVKHNVTEKLSQELLSKYDVLILKTPTMRYEDEEIENITEFVKNGGGLWLIGDHTNVFGMNYYLNFIAKRFGMFFHYDSTYDLDKGTLTFYKRPRVFPHPVVRNMPPFLFATSCTLDADLTAENIIIGYGLRSRLLAYSDKSFFEREPTTDYEFGLFLQSSGIKYGKGRVAAFTDSTCFSNFYMFIPGKPEMAMGYAEWLNRKNKYDFLPGLLGIIAFIAFFFGLNAGSEEKEKRFGLFLFSAFCAAALGIVFFNALSEKSYAFPKPHTDLKTVCFETQYSNIVLPVEKLADEHPDNYHTFYVWTQRMGYVPSLETRLSHALKTGDMVIVINPVKPFTDTDIRQISDFVEKGGRFLLLDGPQNKQSASDRLLKAFDMEIDFSETAQSPLYKPDKEFMGFAQRTGTVKGGNAFLTMQDGNAVFSIAGRGKGFMGVMADSYLFANPQMGGTQISPDQIREQIYRLEFYMIERLETGDDSQSER